MIEFQKAVVKNIYPFTDSLEEVLLDIDHPSKKAINYNKMTGSLKKGDIVLVNTTACSLNLGTGGHHYIMANLHMNTQKLTGDGYGMKLKYTPNQINVLFAEAQESPLHQQFNKELNLEGKQIYIGELHSMLVPLSAHLKYRIQEKIKIACIITDHGALPLWMSKNIEKLKSMGILDTVISIGNAFGGDYECVNIYTALQLGANILNMDAIIITMGPGIMGTGTPYGFSGLELGFYVDLCYYRGAKPLYVPRISFIDTRPRHYGISHHFINSLNKIIQNPIPIIIPNMDKSKTKHIINQLKQYKLLSKHPVKIRDGRGIRTSLEYYQLNPKSMGRGFGEDPDFFYSQGAVIEYGISNTDDSISLSKENGFSE